MGGNTLFLRDTRNRRDFHDEGVVQSPICSMPYKVTQHCRLSVALQPFDQS